MTSTTVTAVRPDGPVQVVELDLDRPTELNRPGGEPLTAPAGPVLALVRHAGRPLGLVGSGGPAREVTALCDDVVAAARRELDLPAPADAPADPTEPPTVSVIVCTHNREGILPRCLDSLLRTGYPHVEVIVVDNAPADDATETLVQVRYPDQVRYLREPVAGLARARNRGLAAARGEICAFADDDLVIDAGWVEALAEPFRRDRRIGCVTGLVLPSELDTPAQRVLERYGGYSKGFAARSWSLADHPDDPLFPFATGRLGTGANMAFRTDLLRAIGGFDAATGTGTPARGGEELLAFLRVLTAGHTIAYRPDALVWHPHPRTMAELNAQVFGFGVGFGAYLTAAVSHRPALLAALVRQVPRGVWQTVRRGRGPAEPAARPIARLGRLELRGLLCGPFCYALSAWREHALASGGQS
ncbi:glycosyltransferase family A protein [Kitasatospora cinereorecta]|uniref:Glycosyltransferase family A protein n=1 Tax=Kitasatospora cinereorecta TaxID=285560 RepID=A0ABW0VLV2_9ACTN